MKPERFYKKRDRDWHPRPLYPAYKSSRLRAPASPLIVIPQTLSELSGPVFGAGLIGQRDHDLITNFATEGEAIGERTIVHGKVRDEDGRPVPACLIEIWQANAGGRYRHRVETYRAPLDPNFGGCGRCLTDELGAYRFLTIRPGPYPWPNGPNDWRPAHIHFSLFGRAFAQRLITQMYFEGDPLIARCPIVGSLADDRAVDRLTARLDMDETKPMNALAYRFDIILRGRRSTPFENRPEGN